LSPLPSLVADPLAEAADRKHPFENPDLPLLACTHVDERSEARKNDYVDRRVDSLEQPR
jgi:hypothetical protein